MHESFSLVHYNGVSGRTMSYLTALKRFQICCFITLTFWLQKNSYVYQNLGLTKPLFRIWHCCQWLCFDVCYEKGYDLIIVTKNYRPHQAKNKVCSLEPIKKPATAFIVITKLLWLGCFLTLKTVFLWH